MAAEDFIINSIIGEGTKLRGDFEELNGLLRIDGEFTGRVRKGGRVLVGVTGNAVAQDVPEGEYFLNSEIIIVGGTIKGNIKASKRIVLLETARIFGNLETPRLVAEEGAMIEGKCSVIKSDANEEDKLSDKKVLTMARKSAR